MCMSNNRQLTMAWIMYADDNKGSVPIASSIFTPPQPQLSPLDAFAWTYTVMDMTGNAYNWDINTDQGTLSPGGPRPLWPYIAKCPGVFKCPADTSYVIAPFRGEVPRCRSDSMNLYLGGFSGTPDQEGATAWETIYMKVSDIVNVPGFNSFGPSKMWVFIDERQDHINYGNYGCDMKGYYDPADPSAYEFLSDMPGINHNNGCGFGFVDGHAEVHHWLDPRTCPPISGNDLLGYNPAPTPSPGNVDIAWLQDHSDRPTVK